MRKYFKTFWPNRQPQDDTTDLENSRAQQLRYAEDLARLRSDFNAATRLMRDGQINPPALETINHLTRLIGIKDTRDAQQGVRIARISGLFARAMDLGDDYSSMLELAAPLHDIGMLVLLSRQATSAQVLDRNAHCALGELILQSDDPLLSMAARIAGAHHEHFDGSGYPNGKCGSAIPLEARIVAVAAYLDGLVCGTHDKQPVTMNQAIRQLVHSQRTGASFDPDIVSKASLLRAELNLLVENFSPRAAHRNR